MKLTMHLRGPADARFVWLADDAGIWYATVDPAYAEAVKEVIEAVFANGNDPTTTSKEKA